MNTKLFMKKIEYTPLAHQLLEPVPILHSQRALVSRILPFSGKEEMTIWVLPSITCFAVTCLIHLHARNRVLVNNYKFPIIPFRGHQFPFSKRTAADAFASYAFFSNQEIPPSNTSSIEKNHNLG
jgi:hypothetical protein